MIRKFTYALLSAQILVLMAVIARAEEPKPNFVAPDAVNYVKLLPDPPAANSPEQAKEIDTTLQLQTTRTPAEVARCKTEEHVSVFAFFSPVLGDWFQADQCPETVAFFTKVSQDTGVIAAAAKDHWHRLRPPASDPRVQPLFNPKGASYPSGHSTAATVYGVILSEALPDLKDSLMARSEQVGWDRVIAGVHFPSDVVEGRVLGKAIAAAMLANPQCQVQLARMKAELQAAAKAHGGIKVQSQADPAAADGCDCGEGCLTTP